MGRTGITDVATATIMNDKMRTESYSSSRYYEKPRSSSQRRTKKWNLEMEPTIDSSGMRFLDCHIKR
jgi:hypothetical protein